MGGLNDPPNKSNWLKIEGFTNGPKRNVKKKKKSLSIMDKTKHKHTVLYSQQSLWAFKPFLRDLTAAELLIFW